jgi:hypothetical protein
MTATPGYKTLAFYATLVMTAFGALAASGSDIGGLGVVGFVITSLAAAGYTGWRKFVKAEAGAKPAYKTTEFWLSIAASIVAGLYASGIFASGTQGDKIIGFAAAVLATLGYTIKPSKTGSASK